MIRFRFSLILLGLLSVLFSLTTRAQEKLPLSVEQAIELGLKNSKSLHSSQMKVKSAEAKVRETDAGRLPSVKLAASYRRLSFVDPFVISFAGMDIPIAPSILDNYGAQVSLFQPLFTGFRLLGASEMAMQNSKATSEEYSKDQTELVFNIKNSYWTLFKAQKLKNVMDENVKMIKSHLDDANNLLKSGLLTSNDVLKLEVQLSDMMYKQIDAENNVKLSMIALNSLINLSLNTEVEITSKSNTAQKTMPELSKLVDEGAQNRAEIKSAAHRIEAGKAGVTMAKSSWYPQISLFGNYYYSRPNQRIFPSVDQFKGTWDAGVNLSVNVWDWLTTEHQTEQAEAQLAQSVDALGIIKDNITLEVTQNYLNVNQSKRRIDISALTVKQAEENMRNTEDKFKNGLATSTDVIDALTALSGAKTNYTTSIVDFELAAARLEKSIGK